MNLDNLCVHIPEIIVPHKLFIFSLVFLFLTNYKVSSKPVLPSSPSNQLQKRQQ